MEEIKKKEFIKKLYELSVDEKILEIKNNVIKNLEI